MVHSDLISGLGTAVHDGGDLPTEGGVVFRFGEFELHDRAHELIRTGKATRLQEQPFQVLRALLERAGQVVTRDQLRQYLWPSSVYVDFDHGLNNAMGRLREALGDPIATPRFIETLPKIGYRFICPVERREPPAQTTEESAPPSPWTRARVLGLAVTLLMVVVVSWIVLSRRHTPEEHPQAVAQHDPEAQRLFAMGIAMLRGRGVERDAERAEQYFQQALARDPQYAAAWAGLAEYHFRKVWIDVSDVEEHTRAGRLAADQAMSLDPDSSEALMARAEFEAWQARSRGDFSAYGRAGADYRRAMAADPANSAIYFNFARTFVWDDPRLSQEMFAQAVAIDPLWDAALSFSALLLSQRGQHAAARTRLIELAAHSLMPTIYTHVRGEIESQLGNLDEAALLLQDSGGAGFELWSLYLSLGDPAAATRTLKDLDGSEVISALRQAMALSALGKADEAFAALDPHCDDFPQTLILDLPTARLALIAGKYARARELLTRRLPDLARGADTVRARNVIPALDLAASYRATGDLAAAQRLLQRIGAYLDGPDAPRWPMFTYLRARTHALADKPEAAIVDLQRAYAEGFRQLWALDLRPQSLLYIDGIDQDPAFRALRTDPRYRAWREQIRADNARMLARLRAHPPSRQKAE